MPRQARLIAAYAILHPEDTQEQLAEKLEGRLDTKQPVIRIIKYYWPLLVKEGIAPPTPVRGTRQPSTVPATEEVGLAS